MTQNGRPPRVKLDGQPPINRPVATSRGNISPNSWANIMNAIVDALVALWQWTTHDAVAAYTAVLAISTIGLWIVTALGIRNQRRDTKILQRAYIAVEPFGIHVVRDSNRVLGHVGIRNAGHLPAKDVSWRVHMRLDFNGGRTDFPIGEESEGRIVITPGTLARQGSQDSASFQEITDCGGGGSAYLYVYGIVQYDDGFHSRRFTKFCHRYNCRAQLAGEIPESGARYHTHGNDAD